MSTMRAKTTVANGRRRCRKNLRKISAQKQRKTPCQQAQGRDVLSRNGSSLKVNCAFLHCHFLPLFSFENMCQQCALLQFFRLKKAGIVGIEALEERRMGIRQKTVPSASAKNELDEAASPLEDESSTANARLLQRKQIAKVCFVWTYFARFKESSATECLICGARLSGSTASGGTFRGIQEGPLFRPQLILNY